MENASKALLIAAGVLITILILTMLITLYTQLSNQSKEYTEITSSIELQKSNSKFEVYVERNDIKAQDVISVVNLAKEANYQIQIYLGTNKLAFNNSYTQEDFLREKQLKTFSCKFSTSESNQNPKYDDDGRIIKLTFTEN